MNPDPVEPDPNRVPPTVYPPTLRWVIVVLCIVAAVVFVILAIRGVS